MPGASNPWFYPSDDSVATITETTKLSGQLRYALVSKTDADSPYSVDAADHVVLVDSSSAVVTVDITTAGTTAGRVILVKDSGGSAATNNITISTEGSETIDGGATATINGNYDSLTFISDGTNWFIV